MSILSQRSLAGGEIAPSIYARTDQSKYKTGLRQCRNFFVKRHGGVDNRPGTQFLSETKFPSKTVRLVRFVFNTEQTYVLEFGDLYMRVHKNGVQQALAAKTITGITQADPAVVTTSGAHGYTSGDEVQVADVVGMTQVNGRNFKLTVLSGTTYSLQHMDGTTDLDSTAFDAYVSGGESAKVYEIVTPYPEADLSTLNYAQSADVITIAHPSHRPRNLSRLGDISWSLDTFTTAPSVASPDYVTAFVGGVASDTYRYKVTAIHKDTGEESLPGRGWSATTPTALTITNITQANPAVVTTSVAHGLVSETGLTIPADRIFVDNGGGMIELEGRTFDIEVVTATTFKLLGEDSSGHTAYSSGGVAWLEAVKLPAASAPTKTNPIRIELGASLIEDASSYNIYRESNGIFGYIGTTSSAKFRDEGLLEPDISDTPPVEQRLFNATDKYPSAVAYFQQRRMFSNTNTEIEKIWGSKTGNLANFSIRSPLQDNDAVSWNLAGTQVNAVKNLIDLGGLVIFTASGEWTAQGNSAGALLPGEINPKQISYSGSGDLRPLIINNTALFVQARGTVVRDLGFDFEVDGYRGNDLTVFAAHLFDNYAIADWAFQQIPHSIVWVARNDGKLLGLTYIKEHAIWGWHQHDFKGGTVENVVSVPEGSEDALYLVIKRTIDGSVRRYLERLHTRKITDIKDSVFVDSSLSHDGANTTATTMTLTAAGGWTNEDSLTMTASASFFAATDVGNEIHLVGSGGTLIRAAIEGYTSPTVVSVRPNKDVPVAMQGVAITSWGKAIKVIGGLWHLEGEEISVLGDGFVAANPNNDAYDLITVADGEATLPKAYVVIHAGQPITADLTTLDIDVADGETLIDKKKNISQITSMVEDSRGMFAGRQAPATDDSLDGLYELKIRSEEGYDDPVALRTGPVDIKIESNWNSNGRVFIRQTDPLPLSVLSIAPSGYIPIRR